MKYHVIVIGGGQSGLAVGYYLRRSGLSHIILDNQKEGGGAWLHTWKSLRLFSPAQWSSLPGMIMTGGSDYYPTKDVAIEYLKSYETKYNLPVKRQVEVFDVVKAGDEFQLQTSEGVFFSKAVVSATGSFSNPTIPELRVSKCLKAKSCIRVSMSRLINSKTRGLELLAKGIPVHRFLPKYRK